MTFPTYFVTHSHILEFIILIRNLAISRNLFLSVFYFIHYPTQIEFSLSQDKGQCDTLEIIIFYIGVRYWNMIGDINHLWDSLIIEYFGFNPHHDIKRKIYTHTEKGMNSLPCIFKHQFYLYYFVCTFLSIELKQFISLHM